MGWSVCWVGVWAWKTKEHTRPVFNAGKPCRGSVTGIDCFPSFMRLDVGGVECMLDRGYGHGRQQNIQILQETMEWIGDWNGVVSLVLCSWMCVCGGGMHCENISVCSKVCKTSEHTKTVFNPGDHAKEKLAGVV